MSLFIIAVMITAFSYVGTLVIRNSNLLASIKTALLIDLANEDRADENIAVLAVSPVLTNAAQQKANDMASKGYFAHISPEGITPWYWFKQVGYDYIFAGENLAVNFTDSVDVHRAWIASPTHKQNILDQRFTEIGIATAEGFYKGRQATFVVQMFGKPRFSLLPSLKAPADVVPITVSGPETQDTIETEVFGAEDTNVSTFEKIIVSPLAVGRTLLVTLLVVLIAALLIRVMVEFRKHHIKKALVLLGLIIFLCGLIYLQKHLLQSTEITDDSSQEIVEI